MSNYVRALAKEIRDATDESILPEGNITLLLDLYAVLLLAKGPAVTDEDVHNAWAAWMSQEDPNHPSIVKYADLPRDTREQDKPFGDAVRAVAKRHSLRTDSS